LFTTLLGVVLNVQFSSSSSSPFSITLHAPLQVSITLLQFS
jgi:hypothetical protein